MLDRIEYKARKNNITNLKTYLIENNNFDINYKFDFILAFWMFHEIHNKNLMFERLYEKLKDGGSLLIVEPKIHVRRKYFEYELELARTTNFKIIEYPQISMSRSVLLKKG